MKKQVSYIADDGAGFSSTFSCREHDATLAGKTFLCPVCKGSGTGLGDPVIRSVYDAEATAWEGQFARPIYTDRIVCHESVPCTVCNGVGWTERQKVPITTESIVGWKDGQLSNEGINRKGPCNER